MWKPKEMTVHGGTCRRWQDNIKMDHEELELKTANCSKLARCTVHQQTLMNK